ncbi:MAG: MTAP family purine nucleoside phosphorylase [Deltaproteobacteria bacterium]|nr:MTAP family purine nucleoside phosphorylase [Deltaproteobacteria bacterium]
MNKVAVIGGSGVLALELFQGLKKRKVVTAYGQVVVEEGNNLFFLQRHGTPPLPPHKLNHQANLKVLQELGVRYVLGVNSTGSLRSELSPGSLLVPDDYFNPWGVKTFFDDRLEFVTPGLSEVVRRGILAAAADLGLGLIDGGTYVQTTGPRFETRAEVRVLAAWGSVVGMTMANEATLARELGLEYASLCLVDNYANGVCANVVDFHAIEKAQQKNSQILTRLLPVVVANLQSVKP